MPAAEGENQPRQFSWVSVIWQVVIIYLCFNMMNPFKNTESTVEEDSVIEIENSDPDQQVIPKQKDNFYCLYSKGEIVKTKLFLVDDMNGESILLHERDITLGSFDDNEFDSIHVDIPVTSNLLNNGSSTLCATFSRNEYGNNFSHLASQPEGKDLFINCNPMVVYQLQKKFIEKQNLISGELDKPDLSRQAATENAELKIVSFWKPNATLTVVDEFGTYKRKNVPEQLRKYLTLTKNGKGYFPITYFNEFWLLTENLIAINDTLTTLPLTIHFEPLSQMKFLLYEQFSTSMDMQKSFGSSEKDIDDIKMMLFETNPYLLVLTVFVTLLHTVFDVLAFKNDITYWKNKKSMVGISVRTIFTNSITQVIIFLYLLDNDTSFMILVSVGIGIFIELWKITKAVNVKIDRSKLIPRIRFEDKESYSSITKEYDDLAFKYLGYALFPLVIGYSIYSLYFETHKSWYSWVLASLTGCVYTFGFIMMTPQLFINYKLKSVAHLPWRTFTYKALNTFIDDLFAFIIRMPTLHRLACFRDDIVFFIFLFQWYMYPKDKRRNEYGEFIEEVEEKEKEEKDENEQEKLEEKNKKKKKKTKEKKE